MHVITHGVGHRGQVSAVMLLNSVTPPKDGFTTYLHLADRPYAPVGIAPVALRTRA